MDPFKLLSRSTNLSRNKQHRQQISTPSSGQNAQPQLYSERPGSSYFDQQSSRKRKRGQDDGRLAPSTGTDAIQFFKSVGRRDAGAKQPVLHDATARDDPTLDGLSVIEKTEERSAAFSTMPLVDRQRVLKQHKLKIMWLNPPISAKKVRRKTNKSKTFAPKGRSLLFPTPLQSFDRLGPDLGVSKRLIANVMDQDFTLPTEVQLVALPLLLAEPSTYLPESRERHDEAVRTGIDLLTVAPTGSGKTLAYMLPLLHNIQLRRDTQSNGDRHISVIVLVPTKELAGQIVNEGRKLAKGTGISISQMRKGMHLASVDDNVDGSKHTDSGVVKADITVSTPGVLQNALELRANNETLTSIDHLVLDEADVLLDPLFRAQTLWIWNQLTNSRLRVSMWSATMGSNIEELAMSTIEDRRHRLAAEDSVTISDSPVVRLVVGLKDSAVPNVQHKLIYAATEQGKLMGLRQLLHPTDSSVYSGPSLRPPFLVFTQTIERAIALHAELLYDIPAEAGGISRIAVLHSDLSDTARDTIMTRFRKGEIWVLITTDLLSRGVDFRGINGVVNYDIPTSSAAYVHRVGRTGRAGREGGVAVTLYSKEDIPYLKHVANVVAMAEKSKGNEDGMQQWLLEAIPKLSKNDKQSLKKRGIESRNTQGRQKDPKGAKKGRISTKAGFVRRAENKRKGAIQGNQRSAELTPGIDEGDETDFGGFD
jgi:ATP-dependent RNA helicase DDX52/ROK1